MPHVFSFLASQPLLGGPKKLFHWGLNQLLVALHMCTILVNERCCKVSHDFIWSVLASYLICNSCI